MDKKKESHVKPYYDTWQIVLLHLPFNYRQGVLLLNLRIPVRDFPGGPVAKTALPMPRAWVQSLVRELDPMCCN